MRWIDIILPAPGMHQELDTLLDKARTAWQGLAEFQARDGLDNVSVVRHLGLVGETLFKAVTAWNEQAFSPGIDRFGSLVPDLADSEHDQLVGFHLVVSPEREYLPWNCLHNGLEFLLVQHPIVTSALPSAIPTGSETRPWMQRFLRAGFLVDDLGETTLRGTLDQLRPAGLASPEFLFVPGHTSDKIRRMIFREGEAIEAAVKGTTLARPLARFHIPSTPITPGELSGMSLAYQALHFAGPVSHPAAQEELEQPDWMDTLVEDMSGAKERALEDAMGIEGEVLGVDPITSLLDDVEQRFEQTQLAGGYAAASQAQPSGSTGDSRGATSGSGGNSGSPWLLPDGPIEPEKLGQGGGIPPLVYSNSYQAMPQLGQRFLAAGASTFIGPVIPLFSRPARLFSAYCYEALGDGWCAGAALWRASRSCRQELGKEHPAWLSYAAHGYGSLALQYL
jgi:hypothetical protein